MITECFFNPPALLSKDKIMTGKTMKIGIISNYGIVDLIKEKAMVRPIVNATDFQVELKL